MQFFWFLIGAASCSAFLLLLQKGLDDWAVYSLNNADLLSRLSVVKVFLVVAFLTLALVVYAGVDNGWWTQLMEIE